MAIDLNNLKDVTPAKIVIESDTITTVVAGGKTLRLETSPEGEEIASGTVPVGKKWTVQWIIAIAETDA